MNYFKQSVSLGTDKIFRAKNLKIIIMNFLAIRTGLGMGIYLSSLALYTHSSYAVSLKFSDRYELTQLEESAFAFQEPSPVGNSPSELPNAAEYLELEIEQQPQVRLESISDIQQLSMIAIPPELQELFLAPETEIQVQIGSDGEEGSLLDYIIGAFSNLQINTINNNSFTNPDVAILPQVAYEDIYRGLYDFDVDVTANPNPSAVAPRSANNSIPEEYLITQESVRNYNPRTFTSSGAIGNQNDLLLPTEYTRSLSEVFGGSTTPREENSTPTNSFLSTPSLSGGNVDSPLGNYVYEDVSTRINQILSQNTDVFLNTEEIEVESNYRYMSASDKFNAQKDPMQQELEEELLEREQRRKEKMQNIRRKLQQEQRQREMKRRREQVRITKQRNNRLRQQTRKQQQTLRQQQQTLGN